MFILELVFFFFFFFLLTKENFSVEVKVVLNHILKYGGPGKEIRDKTRLLRIKPLISDPDFEKDDSGLLSEFGKKLFFQSLGYFKDDERTDAQNRTLLLSYLMSILSPASLSRMETKQTKGTTVGFADAVRMEDTFRLWEILTETHLHIL